jgi:hypothetical protein
MAPPSHRDEKHPDAVMNDFSSYLNNTEDATHRLAILNSTWEFIKNESCNKMYILIEQLHTMELCIYHGIKLELEG